MQLLPMDDASVIQPLATMRPAFPVQSTRPPIFNSDNSVPLPADFKMTKCASIIKNSLENKDASVQCQILINSSVLFLSSFQSML